MTPAPLHKVSGEEDLKPFVWPAVSAHVPPQAKDVDPQLPLPLSKRQPAVERTEVMLLEEQRNKLETGAEAGDQAADLTEAETRVVASGAVADRILAREDACAALPTVG
jgi:hypothetical protein